MVWVGIIQGVCRFDSFIGGLGGCLFVSGVLGNVVIEDLVYMLQEFGFEIGIDLQGLCNVVIVVEQVIG